MDTDWCLTCDRHLSAASPAPYCSPLCRPSSSSSPHLHPFALADDSCSELSDESCDAFYHTIADSSASYTSDDYSKIIAWARDVVPGPPSDPAHTTPSAPSSRASSIRSVSRQSPSKTLTASFQPPALLSSTVRRPLVPSLYITSTHQSPSHLPSPPRRAPSPARYAHSSRTTSTAQDSSALATPASAVGASYLAPGGLLDHVLSWVAPSAPHSPVDAKLSSHFEKQDAPARPPHVRSRRGGRALA